MQLINRIRNTKLFSKFKYRTVKHWWQKPFGELQQFTKFFGNFHYFHNNFFSIYQRFFCETSYSPYLPNFYHESFTIRYSMLSSIAIV